ncbi:hypothetical protein [Litorivivens sp.]|uniref:hypothetical protein n=2 Tax=Litorivivens sp. TaxID=2020868 RepID=UPI00356AF4B0
MVTIDLFRLSQKGETLGHVRILREHGKSFHAVVSYKVATAPQQTISHRIDASNRNKAIAMVLTWAQQKFGSNCSLMPLKNRPQHNHQAYAFNLHAAPTQNTRA